MNQPAALAPPPKAILPPRPGRKLWVAFIGVMIASTLGTALWVRLADSPRMGHPHEGPPTGPAAVAVEVVHPHAGGIDRVCTQPGTVEPLLAVDLKAKVTGYLAEQTVDIGSHVHKDQLLARISIPEYDKQILHDKADVAQARAKVAQMQSRIASTEADARATQAMVAFAEAQVKAKTSYRVFRGKQHERMKELLAQKAVDPRLVDESEDQYQAAVGAELAARESVNAARQQAEAAQAKISQAKADLEEARAGVDVAEANLAKSQVLLDYTRIVAPFDGVITRRVYLPDDYIQAADRGGAALLLTIVNTDVMRVVVQVPDRDVPYVDVGDEAVVEIDALPHRKFSGHVSRKADSEDPTTRLMRTEIDVTNPKDRDHPNGVLQNGMYGQVTITLQKGAASAVTVPSPSVSNQAGDGHAEIRIVRDGKVQVLPIRIGTDNGVQTEVLEGLHPTDLVIVRTSSAVEDGTPVVVVESDPQVPGGNGHP